MIYWMRALASLRLTFGLLAACGVLALMSQFIGFDVGNVIAVPLVLLFINLIAALLVNKRLASNIGLLGFHIALGALALLVAIDQLTAFKGHIEITEGTAFDASLVEATGKGWLHTFRLDDIAFRQGEFSIGYAPGMNRRETVSQVSVYDPEKSKWTEREVGDDHPLVVKGYRFYTSFNKGFAPILTYRNNVGEMTTGSVHLPSYPLNYYNQGNTWSVPGTDQTLKLWLHLPEPVYAEEESWQFHLPPDATLVLMDGDKRIELLPGQSFQFESGTLVFEELRSWMGYTITYNGLIPWMLAAITVGIGFLAYFYLGLVTSERRVQSVGFRTSEGEASC